jgi:hypothetical protein
MSTPAEELRAAATKLRETASKATPGPWRVGGGTSIGVGIEPHSRGSFAYDAIVAEATSEEDRENDVETAFGWDRVVEVGTPAADAEWIALASPALAEPLADLLDSIAAEWDKPPCDAPETCNRCAEPDPVVIDALRLVLALTGDPR